mgnify:CR=1 FL=1
MTASTITWIGGLEASACQFPRSQQIVRAQRSTARRQAEPGKGFEDDIGQQREAIDDERKGSDIEDFLDKPTEHIVFAAERPEQAGQRDINPDQHGGQKADIAAKQAKAAVDIADEGIHKPVDDIEVVHAVLFPVGP